MIFYTNRLIPSGDRIDALVTVAGGAAMLGWLLLIAPLITKII